MVTRTYRVPDVSCQHCVQAITQALRPIDGVREVEVDLATKTVRVVCLDTVPEDRIQNAIEEAGYSVAS